MVLFVHVINALFSKSLLIQNSLIDFQRVNSVIVLLVKVYIVCSSGGITAVSDQLSGFRFMV